MSNLKTTPMVTRDLTADVLLERIQNNFRILRTGSIDEAELKQDLADLVVGLKDIGQELMTEYDWLKELVAPTGRAIRLVPWPSATLAGTSTWTSPCPTSIATTSRCS